MNAPRDSFAGFGQDLPPRSARLRAEASARAEAKIKAQEPDSKWGNWTKAYFELYQSETMRRRQALSFAYALENAPACVMENEFLTGFAWQSGSPDLDGGAPWRGHDAESEIRSRCRAEIPGVFELEAAAIAGLARTPAHVGWHYEWILKDGVTGLLERIRENEASQDAEGRRTLEGMRISLEAVLGWNRKHLAALKELLKANPSDAAALKERIAICERVPESGARNFREALQAFHFSYLCTIFENPNGGNGPGRLDYFLWPYLEKDLAGGTETLQSARELIDELFIRFHERHAFRGDGSVETIVVAGCDLDGECAFNPLSRIMVESIAALKLSHPAVYIRMPDDAPEELLELAAHDVCEGGNRAQIVIDAAAIKAMTRDGHISERDARMYMCGGCMELSPQGMNGDLLFTHFFNVLKTFEYVLTGGVCLLGGERKLPHLAKSLPDFQSFEELYAAFEEELRRELELCFACMDISSEAFEKFRPRFLLSSQTEDCVARGRVINAGGARYEDFGSTPLGIPNVADSFFAIKKAVFEKRSVEPERLLTALRNDFAEDEPLRALLEALPKYGQGDQEADAMAARVARSVCAIYEARTNRLGGKVKPMIMTFMMAPVIGAAAGASPDGRHAKRPVAQGVMPQNAALRRGGLSTAMRSANALNPGLFSGGASAMWDLDSQLAKPQLVKAIIKTFMASGGQMFQGNVCDAETLKDAQARPESYESLLVRIGGYSGRFTTLDRALQGEIIERHRHKG